MLKLLFIRTGWAMAGRKKDEISGVDYYRVVLPAKMLNRYSKKYNCDVKGKITVDGDTGVSMYNRVFREWGYDGLLVKNIDTMKAVAQVLGARDFFEKKVCVDLDDNFNAVSKTSPVYETYYKGSDGCIATNQLVMDADALFCENENLKKAFNAKRSFVLHNYIDRASLGRTPKKKRRKIKIGYFGGVTHRGDVDPVIFHVKQLLYKNPNVEFYIWGADNINTQNAPVKFIEGEVDYNRYLAKLKKCDMDIGIAPLGNTEFNKSKSPCKFFEYSIAGMATVAVKNKGLPYGRVITDGETGLLYNTHRPHELGKKLQYLIDNPGEIDRLAQNAKEYIFSNWCIQDHWMEWEEALDSVYGGK